MRSILLAAAVAASLIPTIVKADIRLGTDGLGDALYIPYYTVEDGQATLLTIANNTDQTKAIRINFTESLNGQSVLYFNLYLAPRDRFSGAIVEGDANSGTARLVSSDASCTVPHGAAADSALVNFDYANNHPDGGPTSPDRTRRGAIEIIEMGEVSGQFAGLIADLDCMPLTNSFSTGGIWSTQPNNSISTPTGGLSASVDIVNVADGLVYNIPATPIQGFTARPDHQDLTSGRPNLRTPVAATAGGNFSVTLPQGTFEVAAARGPDAISALFMAESLMGDFNIETGLDADTRWLVAFPTKVAYVERLPGSLVGNDGLPVAPFTEAFGANGACETMTMRLFPVDGGAADGTSQSVDLCSQNQLVQFGDGSTFDVDSEFAAGRASLDVVAAQPTLTIGSGDNTLTLHGLPMLGYRLSTYVNTNAQPGRIASYTDSEALARTRSQAVDD